MSTRTSFRKLRSAAALTLAVAAVALTAQSAFAGHPIFQRTKPHMGVGIPGPQPPAPHLFKPTMIFNQPRSAASGAEYKYVPVRRTAGVAMEQLELMHEGWLPAPGAASPGPHVKVFSGTRW